MRNLRFLAIFFAFGFVSYQLYNLNSKVRDESVMSSLIEIYTVTSDDRLSLRKGPGTEEELIMRLDGIESGKPAEVILIAKESEDWWKVQYIDENEKPVQGYVASEYLKLAQSIEAFSLFWIEKTQVFKEEDSDACERKEVSYEDAELVALDLGEALFKDTKIKSATDEMRVFSGALLRRTLIAGEFEVLTNPILEDDKTPIVKPGSIISLNEAEVVGLKDKRIVIPELAKHIENVSSIAESFKVDGTEGNFYEYNCCLEGMACESFVKLNPVGDALQEVLMLPYKKQSVYSKLQVKFDKIVEALEEVELENERAYEADSPKFREFYGKTVEYTNYEDYFLGPKGVDNRDGGDVYRLNVRASAGSVKDGPCGSYHYNPENFGGLIGGDRYIKKEVLGCFLATLQVFKKEHPEARVQWGDISRGDRTSFRPDHSTHLDGRDIDVRPIRKDKKLLGCQMAWECYDREMTQAFIEIAMRFGGDPVYFNDTEVNKTSSKIQHSKGHHDHFHIRYSRECTGVTLDTKYCPREGFN